MSAEIMWVNAANELPDDEMTVLVALADGEVWTGFHLDGTWRFVSGEEISSQVTWWANFPEPPVCDDARNINPVPKPN